MADKLVRRPVRRTSRRTFAEHAFGVGPDCSLDLLKDELYEAGMTAASRDKIDLVMIEDYNHLTDLVAEEGVPLARDPDAVPTVTVRYIHVQRRWFYAFMATLPPLLLLAGGQLWDILPWK